MSASSTKKRRAKFLGGHPQSHNILADNGDGTVELITGRIVEEGEALPAGTPLYAMHDDKESGGHILETIVEGKVSRVDTRAARASAGPPKVSSPDYRRGYDAIWPKSKGPKSKAN